MPTWKDVVAIAGALPEVEETTWFNTPSLKVKGKGFARLRAEAEGGLVLFCEMEEKEALLQSGDPAFFTTPHYDGHPTILVDLEKIDRERLAEMIEESWYRKAPVRVRKQHEEARSSDP